MYQFLFHLKYIDEINFTNEEAYGIVAGDSHAEAVKRIADYYGDKNIVEFYSLYGCGLEDDPVVLTKEEWERIYNDN